MPLHLFLDTDFTDREKKEKTPKKNVTVKVELANTMAFLRASAKVMWVYTGLGGCPLLNVSQSN